MTDIVERLRMDADNMNPYCVNQDEIMEAADTIETLRQKVKELEVDNGLTIAYMSGFRDGKKDAQQQGDPVLYQCTKCGGANYACDCDSFRYCTKPLYAEHEPKP